MKTSTSFLRCFQNFGNSTHIGYIIMGYQFFFSFGILFPNKPNSKIFLILLKMLYNLSFFDITKRLAFFDKFLLNIRRI